MSTNSSNNGSVFSCALVEGGLGRENTSQGEQQSLFARSAALQKKEKNLAATLNCERTFIVDFDSSVADDNNTFSGPYQTAITGAGSLRNDQQSGNHKSRFSETTSLYGTIPLKGHFTNTSSIARSRLLSAQINAREYQLIQSSQAKSCQQLNELVCACPINPETHIGAGSQHTFAISEKFCIDDLNQTLSVENSRTKNPFVFPKTKTCVSAVECVRQEAISKYFQEGSCRDLICSNLHLHFETCEPHNFVPGIRFTLLNTSNFERADNEVDPECINPYEPCPELDDLLKGETSAYEVYDILDANSFLAVPFKRQIFNPECGPVCEQFVGSQSCITNIMFRRRVFDYVSRDELSCAPRGDTTHFYGRYQIGKCGCCPAWAYICCPTSPQQLAAFGNQIIQSSIYSGILTNIRDISYNALLDEFSVEFQPEPGCDTIIRRTKNLLGTTNQYSSISLSRNAMLAVANCPEAKENYLNRALRSGHYFDIVRGCNDRFILYIFIKSCQQIHQFEIVLPPGLYKPGELVDCLGKALNAAVECEKTSFQFVVEFTLHPTKGLIAWQQIGQKNVNAYPTVGTSPYESQTFGIIIKNLIPYERFAIDFGALASTLDFEARKTEFAGAHASRAVAGILQVVNGRCEKRVSPPCKPQCMRALYSSKVDRCTGLVTIEQNGFNPLLCNSLQAYLLFSRDAACCEDGPDNEIDNGTGCHPDEIQQVVPEPCAVILNECCKPIKCCKNKKCKCDPCQCGDNCKCGEQKECDNAKCKCDPCKCDDCKCGESSCGNDKCGCDPCVCTDCKCGQQACGNSKCNCDPCECIDCKCGIPVCGNSQCKCFPECKCGPDCDCGEEDGCGPCEKPKTKCEPNSTFLSFQLPEGVLPVCENDIVWITFNCRTIAACVTLVSRDCERSACSPHIKYKLALGYGARSLYNLLRGVDETSSPLPSYLPVKVSFESIGFNLHFNSASTETTAATENALTPVRPATQNAITKWLGFYNTTTLTGRKFYVSNSCIQSLLDERLILLVPEIERFARAEPRYGVYSPSDKVLVRHYGVLILDRPSGVYKYDNSSDSLLGFMSMDRCTIDPCNSVSCSNIGPNSSVQHLSFHLLRSDGSAYVSCGDSLIASVEICYSN